MLAELGFGRGDKLAVIGDNRPALYDTMLATQALGGVPLPLYQGLPEHVATRARAVWRVRPDRVEAVPFGTLPEEGKVLVDERPWDG